jgi:hypothetical protein
LNEITFNSPLMGELRAIEFVVRLIFKMLRDHGRRAVRSFLDTHFDDIGVRGTVDLAQEVQAEWA